MWTVNEIEFRPVELDFTSSGQKRHQSTAVFADGMEFINALDLVDFRDDPVQLSVCGHCGSTGCAPGNWVSPRRLGDGLLLIPAFRAMLEESGPHHPAGAPGMVFQHEPPYSIESKGIAYLTGSALGQLASLVPQFCELGRWPALSGKEVVWLLQWRAPAKVLGELPESPRVHRELVIAADPGEPEEHLPVLEKLLTEAFAGDHSVTLTAGNLVTFYLDQPGVVEWTPLAYSDGRPLLAIGPDCIVSIRDV